MKGVTASMLPSNQALIDAVLEEKKKKTNTLILAHTYQAPRGFGGSGFNRRFFRFGESGRTLEAPRALLCGVRFMAETLKILSPEKEVLLSHPDAGCPMAEQIDPRGGGSLPEGSSGPRVLRLCEHHHRPAEGAGRCVRHLFLRSFHCEKASLIKIFYFYLIKPGFFRCGCGAGENHPFDERLLSGPQRNHRPGYFEYESGPSQRQGGDPSECPREAVALADMIGSTKEIIDYVNTGEDDIILATERGVYDNLVLQHPRRTLYQLCPGKNDLRRYERPPFRTFMTPSPARAEK